MGGGRGRRTERGRKKWLRLLLRQRRKASGEPRAKRSAAFSLFSSPS
jgi:hypothetical protein